jgi:hypothetical protein
MARKAHGIGDLTPTEQQSGYDPIRFAKQIEGCRPEIRVDAKGFKYTAYVRIEPKKKEHKDRIKPIKQRKASDLSLQEEKELILGIDLDFHV